jgi:MHS family proline/betaine transporter-like MFS transporter
VAFLVRPLGAMVFGPLGDKIGRRSILATTVIMMAVGTFAIGLIPSHAAIGVVAPALLIFFRLVQGFSTGGEYGGAATFIAEYAPDKRRGFFGSFLEFGTLAGYVGASGLVVVLSGVLTQDQMLHWGWRIPFLVAAPLGLIGLYLRLRLDETPAFQKLEGGQVRAAEDAAGVETSATADLGEIFTHHWRPLVLCLALVAAYNVTDYMLLSYMPTYLSDELGYDTDRGLLILVIVMVVQMCVINQVGRLSDRFGRRPMLMTGMLGFLVRSVPSFLLIREGSVLLIGLGLLLLGLSLVALLGTMSAALPAFFPTHVRYGSLAIAYNFSTSFFGGTTPPGHHCSDQRLPQHPHARLLRVGRRGRRRRRGAVHAGDRQQAAGRLPALRGDGGGGGRAPPGPVGAPQVLKAVSARAAPGAPAAGRSCTWGPRRRPPRRGTRRSAGPPSR